MCFCYNISNSNCINCCHFVGLAKLMVENCNNYKLDVKIWFLNKIGNCLHFHFLIFLALVWLNPTTNDTSSTTIMGWKTRTWLQDLFDACITNKKNLYSHKQIDKQILSFSFIFLWLHDKHVKMKIYKTF